jgi:hypothetical protein
MGAQARYFSIDMFGRNARGRQFYNTVIIHSYF